MRQISVCIPTYERVEMLFESFEKVKDNDNISEIIIVDDASSMEVYERIKERAKENDKIKLFRNDTNRDCHYNKMTAISLVSNEWCCLWDSDNVFDFSYLYSLFQNLRWDERTIYTPSFAEPTFSFEQFAGLLITKGNVSRWIDEPMFETMLNASNFFVNKKQYLKVWDGSVDPVTSDSIFFAYKWLEAGNKIQVVEGMRYFHRVHSGSHYQNNVARTPNGFHESVLNNLRQLV